jgi:hypothetical protein
VFFRSRSADRAAGLDPISAFFIVRDATRAHLPMIADKLPLAAPILMQIEAFAGPIAAPGRGELPPA